MSKSPETISYWEKSIGLLRNKLSVHRPAVLLLPVRPAVPNNGVAGCTASLLYLLLLHILRRHCSALLSMPKKPADTPCWRAAEQGKMDTARRCETCVQIWERWSGSTKRCSTDTRTCEHVAAGGRALDERGRVPEMEDRATVEPELFTPPAEGLRPSTPHLKYQGRAGACSCPFLYLRVESAQEKR